MKSDPAGHLTPQTCDVNLADLPQNSIRVWLVAMSQPLPLPSVFRPRADTLLTERQTDCLRLASEGLSSRQIGRQLQVSARTVDDHILVACQALGVRTRIQAVALLVRSDRREGERRIFLP